MADKFKAKLWQVGILLLAVIITGGCAAPTEAPLPPEEEKPPPVTEEIKRIVEVEAVNQTLHYQRESFWSAEIFLGLSANKGKFEADFMSSFDSNLAEYNLYAQNYEISFDEVSSSTKVTCHIYNGISKTGDRYTARFQWLLYPLGLDFIDDDFEKSQNVLSWQGYVDSIPMTISLEFPHQDSPYAAWHEPNGHCHAHVWWELSR